MLSDKCSCFKFNKKKCNKDRVLFIKNFPLCLNHSLLLYNKYVLIIQKFYRGYKARRYLVNIFNNLPSDLQKLVINYINDGFYEKKYLNTLSKIVINNTYNFHNYNNSDERLSVEYLYNCYKLYNKYHYIININYLKHAFVLGDHILNLCDTILQQDQVILTYSYYVFDKINFNIQDQNVIFDLVDIIYKFSNLYSLNYDVYNRNDNYILNA